MTSANRHATRKYSTEARIQEPDGTKRKVQVYVYSCAHCASVHQFVSRNARDRAAAEHEKKGQ